MLKLKSLKPLLQAASGRVLLVDDDKRQLAVLQAILASHAIETRVATSLLIRILYRLFRECRKSRGDLYVCGFPSEYMISLSTLGLTELPGFRLKPTEEAAIEEIRKGSPSP